MSVWESRADPGIVAPLVVGTLRRSSGLLRLLGIDAYETALVMQTRLTLLRRLDVVEGSGLSFGMMTVLAGFGFTLQGILAGIAALFVEDPALWLAGTCGLLMISLSLLLLLLQGQILFDPTDLRVLAVQPVEGSSIVVTRILALAGFALGLVVPFAFFPTMLGALTYQRAAVLWAVPVALGGAAALATTIVVLVAAAVLRVFGPRAFGRTFAALQVAAIAFGTTAGAWLHLLADIVPRAGMTSTLTHPASPLGWYGGLLTEASLGRNALRVGALTLVPLVIGAFAARLAARDYVASVLHVEGSVSAAPRWPGGRIRAAVFRTLNRPEERAGFTLAAALVWRDKLVRNAVAGSTVWMLVGPLMVLLAPDLLPPAYVALVPWMLAPLLVLAPEPIGVTDQPAGAASIENLPLPDRRGYLRGAVIGLWSRLALPGVFVAVAVASAATGIAGVVDAMLAVGLAAALGFHFARSLRLPLPFSMPRVDDGSIDNLGPMFVCTLSALVLGSVHGLAIARIPVAARALFLVPALFVARIAYRRMTPRLVDRGVFWDLLDPD